MRGMLTPLPLPLIPGAEDETDESPDDGAGHVACPRRQKAEREAEPENKEAEDDEHSEKLALQL